MLPNPRTGRGFEADQFERENEAKLGQLHNRISNLKNVSLSGLNFACPSTRPRLSAALRTRTARAVFLS